MFVVHLQLQQPPLSSKLLRYRPLDDYDDMDLVRDFIDFLLCLRFAKGLEQKLRDGFSSHPESA